MSTNEELHEQLTKLSNARGLEQLLLFIENTPADNIDRCNKKGTDSSICYRAFSFDLCEKKRNIIVKNYSNLYKLIIDNDEDNEILMNNAVDLNLILQSYKNVFAIYEDKDDVKNQIEVNKNKVDYNKNLLEFCRKLLKSVSDNVDEQYELIDKYSLGVTKSYDRIIMRLKHSEKYKHFFVEEVPDYVVYKFLFTYIPDILRYRMLKYLLFSQLYQIYYDNFSTYSRIKNPDELKATLLDEYITENSD